MRLIAKNYKVFNSEQYHSENCTPEVFKQFEALYIYIHLMATVGLSGIRARYFRVTSHNVRSTMYWANGNLMLGQRRRGGQHYVNIGLTSRVCWGNILMLVINYLVVYCIFFRTK